VRSFGFVGPAEEDDGQATQRRVAVEEATEFLAGQVRHDCVGYDRVNRRRERGLHGLKPVGGCDDGVTGAAQGYLKVTTEGTVILGE
jgi:hypothetical protein